jgi:hypothetical protein
VRVRGFAFRGAIVRAIMNKIGTSLKGTVARPVPGSHVKVMETAVLVSAGILLAVLGGLIGVALGRYVWPAIRGCDTAALLAAQLEAARLEEECRLLRTQAEQLEAERAARMEELCRSGEEAARLGERVGSLARQAEEQGKLVCTMEGQRDVAAAEAKSAAAEVARLKEREKSLSEKVAEQAALLADQQKQLTTEFENIANRILKANASELSDSSQKALAASWTRCGSGFRISRRRLRPPMTAKPARCSRSRSRSGSWSRRAARSARRRTASQRRYEEIRSCLAAGASWRSNAFSKRRG